MWGKTLLSTTVRRLGLLVVIVTQPLVFIFGVYFTGLFKDPTIYVGMIGRLVRGAMDLARPI